MAMVVVDLDPPQADAPGFTSSTEDLVYFLSWAYATRYGASHELSMAARALRQEFGLDLQPLLTFADRDVEDPDDQAALDLAWQDAVDLARCCREVSAVLSTQESRFSDPLSAYPNLRSNVEELGEIAAWAVDRGSRIRVTYDLEGAAP